MFPLTIYSSDPVFKTWLQTEGEHEGERYIVVFPSMEEAARNLAVYAMHGLKQNVASKLPKHHGDLVLKGDINPYLSEKIMTAIEREIERKWLAYVHTEEEVDFEGFVSFRLQEERTVLQKEIHTALESYLGQDQSNSAAYFREMMRHQSSVEEELSLVVEQGEVIVRGKEKVYFRHPLSSHSYEAEDEAITNIIILSPTFLHVFDPHHALSKQTVIILSEMFQEKVQFQRG